MNIYSLLGGEKKEMVDIEKILNKLEPVGELPKTKRGSGLRHTWKPVLDEVVNKGYFRLSEDDVSIQSAMKGLKKEADNQGITIALNTRTINKKVYLYIQVQKPKK